MTARAGFVHQALCYGSDDEFLAGTLGFVDEGLTAGDAVLAVVSGGNLALLRSALGGAAEGVEFVDSLDWYGFPSRTLGQYHDYCTAHEEDGARRVRVIGEPVWAGRTELETREWMRYESLLNVAFADSGHWILCPYDTRALPAEVVDTARRTHPELALGTAWAASERYAEPGDFAAECDDLERELTASADPAGEVPFARDQSVAARLAAAQFARRCGLPEDRIHDLVAAVHEAVVNAVRFGGGDGTLRMWSTAGYVICEVTDAGHGEWPPARAAFPGHIPPDPRAARGHGMWVVRQLSDLAVERMSPGGSAVRMYFRRR